MNTVTLSTLELRAGRVAWLRGAAVALLAVAPILGCDASSAPAKSPADQAAELVRTRCAANADEAALAQVLDGSAIESVEPLYNSVVGYKSGQFTELAGTAIKVRAVQGVTAEWLTRALECHSAKRVLGTIASTVAPNDPFWLPGRTVDIDATSAHDGFRVEVRAAGPVEGREVLDRAKAFVQLRDVALRTGQPHRAESASPNAAF
jgi:hypothetical protein